MDYYTIYACLNNRYFGIMNTFEGCYDDVMYVAWEWINQGYYVKCVGENGTMLFNPDILDKLRENHDYVELIDCLED